MDALTFIQKYYKSYKPKVDHLTKDKVLQNKLRLPCFISS